MDQGLGVSLILFSRFFRRKMEVLSDFQRNSEKSSRNQKSAFQAPNFFV